MEKFDKLSIKMEMENDNPPPSNEKKTEDMPIEQENQICNSIQCPDIKSEQFTFAFKDIYPNNQSIPPGAGGWRPKNKIESIG